MITEILYRIYGLLRRAPWIGPRVDRWVRRHRHWAYRLRDQALRLDRLWPTRRRAGADAPADAPLQDLAWMLAGLRDAVARTEQRLQALELHVLVQVVAPRMARTEQRLQALEQRPSPAQQLDDVLSRHHHALNLKVDATLQALLQRVERAERQFNQATVQASRPIAAARVLSAAKLAEHMARPQGLWLELGCGEHPDPDRINVDLRPLPGVDIVADVTQLPLPDHSVADLRAAHLVEHFTAQHFVTRVLPEWHRVLAPGAALRLITPDLPAMLQAHLRGELSEADLVHVLYGGQDYEGDFHYHAYSPDALAALLRAHGFGSIDIVAQGRRNGLCLEFELIARKTTPAQA